MAVQFNTSIQWKPYRESKFLNFAYMLMPWKGGPGWVEVEQNQKRIQEQVTALFDRSVDGFLNKLSEGPEPVMRYLSASQRIRDESFQSISEAFASASDINSEVLGETREGIKRLALVKAASTITLAGLSGGVVLAGGSVGLVTAAQSVSLGFSLTKAVVTNWGEVKMAGALAIELAKDQVPEKGGKMLSAAGMWNLWQTAPKWADAQKRVMKLSGDLAKKVSSQKRSKIGRKLINAQKDLAVAEAQAAKGAKMVTIGKNIARYAPVVFAGWDMYDAIVDYGEDTSL
jgi:hypothetical protein